MKSPFIIFLSLVAAAFLLATATASGQRVKKSEFTSAQLNNPSVSKITWTTTTINSRFEPQKGEVLQTQKIVDKYKPEVDFVVADCGFADFENVIKGIMPDVMVSLADIGSKISCVPSVWKQA